MKRFFSYLSICLFVIFVYLSFSTFPVQAGCTGVYDQYDNLINCTLSTADGCTGCKKNGDICQCTGYTQPTNPPPKPTNTPIPSPTLPSQTCGQQICSLCSFNPCTGSCTDTCNTNTNKCGYICTSGGACTSWGSWGSCSGCYRYRDCTAPAGNTQQQRECDSTCASNCPQFCSGSGANATPTPYPTSFCQQMYFCDTRAGSATQNTCIQTNAANGYNNASPYYQCPGTTTTCSQNLQTYLGISGSCYTSQASCQATCPTSTPTPGPYIKLKNSSFVSGNSLKDDIPAVPTAYDADDDGTANFIITQGGIVAAPSVNLTTYNASAKPNPGNWSAAYTPAPFSMTPSNFLNYLKARKSFTTISDLGSINTNGIYYYNGASPLTLTSVPPQFNSYKVVLVTSGEVDINMSQFNPIQSVALIASTINFSSSVTEADGIFIAEQTCTALA